MDDQPTDVELVGGIVEVGDWIVWVRLDEHTDCSAALSNATTVSGGAVYAGSNGEPRIMVALSGEIDGFTDPDPHDGVQIYGGSQEHPSSTFTMCHASARDNNKTSSQEQAFQIDVSISWVAAGRASSPSVVRTLLLHTTATSEAITEAWKQIPLSHQAEVASVIIQAWMNVSSVNVTQLIGKGFRRRLQASLSSSPDVTHNLSSCNVSDGLYVVALSFSLADVQQTSGPTSSEITIYVQSIITAALNPPQNSSSNLSACSAIETKEIRTVTQPSIVPQKPTEFVHFPGVKLFTQHAPPSPPPPTPPSPSPPPPSPPPSLPPPDLPPTPPLPLSPDPAPYIDTVDLDENRSAIVVFFSEPVVPSLLLLDSETPLAVEASNFHVELAPGSAFVANWSIVYLLPASSELIPNSGRRLQLGETSVALQFTIQGSVSPNGQTISVGAVEGALVDLAGKAMEPTMFSVGSLTGTPVTVAFPLVPLVAAAASVFVLAVGLLVIHRWRRRRQRPQQKLDFPQRNIMKPPAYLPAHAVIGISRMRPQEKVAPQEPDLAEPAYLPARMAVGIARMLKSSKARTQEPDLAEPAYLPARMAVGIARMLKSSKARTQEPDLAEPAYLPARMAVGIARMLKSSKARTQEPDLAEPAYFPARMAVGIARMLKSPAGQTQESQPPRSFLARTMFGLASVFTRGMPSRKPLPTPELHNINSDLPDLEAIGRQAELEVARRCRYVRLRWALRRIELLEQVNFHGSKHSTGVDVYLEPKKADNICREVAMAFQICNNLLTSLDFSPFGLAVDGHTSASIHGHQESLRISSLRAAQCAMTVRAHLIEQGCSTSDDSNISTVHTTAQCTAHSAQHAVHSNSAQHTVHNTVHSTVHTTAQCTAQHSSVLLVWGLPIDSLVSSRGHGFTKPLPAFADGGNHPENRRVEMRLLRPGEEGYCSTFRTMDDPNVQMTPYKVASRQVDGGGDETVATATDQRRPRPVTSVPQLGALSAICTQQLQSPLPTSTCTQPHSTSYLLPPTSNLQPPTSTCRKQSKTPPASSPTSPYRLAFKLRLTPSHSFQFRSPRQSQPRSAGLSNQSPPLVAHMNETRTDQQTEAQVRVGRTDHVTTLLDEYKTTMYTKPQLDQPVLKLGPRLYSMAEPWQKMPYAANQGDVTVSDCIDQFSCTRACELHEKTSMADQKLLTGAATLAGQLLRPIPSSGGWSQGVTTGDQTTILRDQYLEERGGSGQDVNSERITEISSSMSSQAFAYMDPPHGLTRPPPRVARPPRSLLTASPEDEVMWESIKQVKLMKRTYHGPPRVAPHASSLMQAWEEPKRPPPPFPEPQLAV